MIIYHLDEDPIKAAKYLCDKHITNQAVETAQILCTVSHRWGKVAVYKKRDEYHPSVLWAGNSKPNWEWTVKHGFAICEEYARRYGRTHKSREVVQWCEDHGGRPVCGIPGKPPLIMPEEFKLRDIVEAYRAFYISEKSKFAEWTRGGVGQPS